jgi:hypothetical protein
MSNEYNRDVANTQGALLKSPIFFIIMAILVGIGSFGLGRVTKIDETREPVQIQGATAQRESVTPIAEVNSAPEPTPAASAKAPLDAGQGKFVASKTGAKYFSLSCSGAKNIKEANRVYFQTEDAAKAAGYTPSATCKDLN